MLSDQGSQFESNEFQTFLKSYGIRKLRTNAYHPQGNGICERFNGTLKRALLSYVTEKSLSSSSWVRGLDHCLLDYRTTSHSATGSRPVDLFFPFNVKGFLPSRKADDNALKRSVVLDEAYKRRTASYTDLRAREINFDVDSDVLVRDINRTKFSVKGSICKVVRQVDHNVVVVKDQKTGREFRCNVARVSKLPSVPAATILPISEDEGSESGSTSDGENNAGPPPQHGLARNRTPGDQPGSPPPPPRRSGRVSHVPNRYDDFDMNILY